MNEAAFKIHGTDCAEEVGVLKREVAPVAGGEERLGFDILNAKMTIRGQAPPDVEAVMAAVARTGMRAEPWRDAALSPAASTRFNPQALAGAASFALLSASYGDRDAESGS